MNTHKKINKLLTGFALGELSEEQQAEVNSHIIECDICREELRAIKAVLECAESLRQCKIENDSAESAKNSVISSIQNTAQPSQSESNWRTIMNKRIPILAAAASIILVSGIALALFTNNIDSAAKIAQNNDDQTIKRIVADDPHVSTNAIAKDDFKKLQQLFLAGNVEALRNVLQDGNLQSKIIAANFLAQMGDLQSIETLQQLDSEYGDTETAFAEAVLILQAASAQDTTDDAPGTIGEKNDVANEQICKDIIFDGDHLLRLIPAESLACVRMNNLDFTLGLVDQYLAGISPIPFGATAMTRMQLAGLLGDPALNNINTAGDFAFFVIVPPNSKENTSDQISYFPVLLVPVTDYEKFVNENPNCHPPDANGISVINSGGTIDPKKKVLVTNIADYALITGTSDYDKLLATVRTICSAKAGIGSLLDSDQIHSALNDPLWALGNIPQVAKVLGPVIFEGLEQIQTQMSQQKNIGGAPAAAMNMYFGAIDIFLSEVASVSLSLKPTAELCSAMITVKAVPDTILANALVADNSAGPINPLLGYLRDGSFMNLAVKKNSHLWQEYSLSEFDLMSLITDQNIPEEIMIKQQETIIDMIDSLGNYGIFSMYTNESANFPFASTFVFEIPDPVKFNNAITRSVEQWNTLALTDIYDAMEMNTDYNISWNVSTYKDCSINSASISMTPNDPNSEFGKMIDNMYGGGFDYRWTMIDNLFVGTMSDSNSYSDPNHALYQLIDTVKSGSAPQLSAEITSSLSALTNADNADFLGTYNFLEQMKMGMNMMGNLPGSDLQMPNFDIETISNLAFAGKAADSKLVMEIAIPKQHVMEIKTVFEEMQKQQMEIITQKNEPREITDTGFTGNQSEDRFLSGQGNMLVRSLVTITDWPENPTTMKIALPKTANIQSITLNSTPVQYQALESIGFYQLQLPQNFGAMENKDLEVIWSYVFREGNVDFRTQLKGLIPVRSMSLTLTLEEGAAFTFKGDDPSKKHQLLFKGKVDEPKITHGSCSLNIRTQIHEINSGFAGSQVDQIYLSSDGDMRVHSSVTITTWPENINTMTIVMPYMSKSKIQSITFNGLELQYQPLEAKGQYGVTLPVGWTAYENKTLEVEWTYFIQTKQDDYVTRLRGLIPVYTLSQTLNLEPDCQFEFIDTPDSQQKVLYENTIDQPILNHAFTSLTIQRK